MDSKKISGREVIARLMTVLNVNSDYKLAEYLGISRSTIATCKYRDTVPYDACLIASFKANVSLDWLLTGEGSIYKSFSDDGLSIRERSLLSMFRDLPDEEQSQVVGYIQDKKRFEDMAKMLNQLLQTQKTA